MMLTREDLKTAQPVQSLNQQYDRYVKYISRKIHIKKQEPFIYQQLDKSLKIKRDMLKITKLDSDKTKIKQKLDLIKADN